MNAISLKTKIKFCFPGGYPIVAWIFTSCRIKSCLQVVNFNVISKMFFVDFVLFCFAVLGCTNWNFCYWKIWQILLRFLCLKLLSHKHALCFLSKGESSKRRYYSYSESARCFVLQLLWCFVRPVAELC